MKKLLLATLCAQLVGCASWRYPNWEYVRIESQVPASCSYKMQESCTGSAASCPKWYKQRATKFGANTVVLATEKPVAATGIQINTTINSYVQAPAIIAEYYFCNGAKNIIPK